MPVRLEKDLQEMLRRGARRTPHKKQELIRITLRRHLQQVIDQEAVKELPVRVTNIEPWPRRVLENAYRRMGEDWTAIENAAIHAQGKPDLAD